jgi:alpha-L-fucosidase
VWYPAECDVSIRPGWFYHAEQDGKVKSLAQLLDIYYRSIGRNSLLLLNVPPDRRGLFHENDVARLREFREVRDATFKTNLALGCPVRTDSPVLGDRGAVNLTDDKWDTYWTTAEGVSTGALEVNLGRPARFDRAMLQEQISVGQRVERFAIDAWQDGQWRTVAEATTIGYKRLLRFPEVSASRVRLRILESRDSPALCEFGLFKASNKEQTP